MRANLQKESGFITTPAFLILQIHILQTLCISIWSHHWPEITSPFREENTSYKITPENNQTYRMGMHSRRCNMWRFIGKTSPIPTVCCWLQGLVFHLFPSVCGYVLFSLWCDCKAANVSCSEIRNGNGRVVFVVPNEKIVGVNKSFIWRLPPSKRLLFLIYFFLCAHFRLGFNFLVKAVLCSIIRF